MMRKNILLLTAIATTAVSSAQTEYYQNVQATTHFCDACSLDVMKSGRGSPAYDAGLLVRDRIVAVDGVRIRSRPEYNLVCLYHKDRRQIPLAVNREGLLQELCIVSRGLLRGGGFLFADPKNSFLTRLSSGGVTVGSFALVKSDTTQHDSAAESTEELFRLFDEAEVPAATADGLLLESFCGRGKEAVAATLAGGSQAERQWVGQLLALYLHLCREEYEHALAIANAGSEMPSGVDPFLSALFAFYASVARNPPDPSIPDAWAAYGVDLLFFVTCYPYPVLPSPDTHDVFGFDPEFQDLYDRSKDRDLQTTRRRNIKVRDYAAGGADITALDELYIALTRAALIAPGSIYETKLRDCAMIRYRPSRTILIRGLRKRFENLPNERVLTAFSLLYPAIYDGDEDLFTQAYKVLVDAGTREQTTAHEMVDRISERMLDISLKPVTCPPHFRRIAEECDRPITVPLFYRQLARVSPAFRYRLRKPYYIVEDKVLGSVRDWTIERLVDVTKALSDPIDLRRRDSALAAAQSAGMSQEVRDEAMHVLVREMSEDPKQETFDAFIALAGNSRAGLVMDSLRTIAGGNLHMGMVDPFDARELLERTVVPVECRNYEAVVQTLQTWAPADPEIPDRARELYASTGTPMTCLLISRALRSVGDFDAAKYYEMQTIDLLAALSACQSPRGKHALGDYALRLWVPAPEFAHYEEQFRPLDSAQSTMSVLLLQAALRWGATNDIEFLKTMVRAQDATEDGAPPCIAYRGRLYDSNVAFRDAVLCEAFTGPRRSVYEGHLKSRLRGLDWDAILKRPPATVE